MEKSYIEVKISDIIPYKYNNKKHKDRDVNEVIKSIKNNGDIAPMIIDENNVLLVWHGRLLAFKKLKYKTVKVLQVIGMTEEQKKDYRIRDNTTSFFSEFDFENIRNEILALWDEGGNLVWHLEWLDMFEGINFFENNWEYDESIEDEIIETQDTEKIEVKKWDIFKLWNHTLMCWSSTSWADVALLMNWQKADCVITDPPYLMNFSSAIDWKWNKSNKHNHRKIENDNLKWEEAQKFLQDFLQQIKSHCVWSYYIFFYRLWIDKMFKAMEVEKMTWRNLIIWKKDHLNLSPTDYKSIYEPIINWWADDYQPIFYGWNDEHNFYWRKWELDFIDWIQVSSILVNERTKSNDLHPTMKPITLLEKILNNSTRTANKVLDLFWGSGSTLIACEKKDRICYMMELDEKYCQTIIKRFYKVTNWTKPISCINRDIDFNFLKQE